MVNYSREFIDKCKLIYPVEKGLHESLERKALLPQSCLGDLFYEYKLNFAEMVSSQYLNDIALMKAIHKLRIASELQSESKNFD